MRIIYLLVLLVSWYTVSPATASYSAPVIDYSDIVSGGDNE